MKTSGHLNSNMGIRGHSAGAYFPFIVMAQGTPDDLTWWAVHPNGTKLQGFKEASRAHSSALGAFKLWQRGILA